MPPQTLERRRGESVGYRVAVDGISVGTIDFRVAGPSRFEGTDVIEYQSRFQADPLIDAFMSIRGSAASFVPSDTTIPAFASSAFRMASNRYEERALFSAEAAPGVSSTRTRNGKHRAVQRPFAEPVRDFVSAFYMVRKMPRDMKGCAVIYGNQKAYTVWVEPRGEEEVTTPVGRRPADRYRIRYASERGRWVARGYFWLSRSAQRLPYRAEVEAKGHRVVATVQRYVPGR